ncbi:hypothetical protein [Prescottella subtropica]|uniref:hypothetical protein n=1 Tax=Prescottella subtropica TaxID=2545757 RepID=UPI001F5008C8|nr:hypothetical protein [Prescottella subtropica]
MAAAESSLGSSGSSGSLSGSEGSSGSLGSSGPAPQDPFTFTGWDTCPVEDLLNKNPDTGQPVPTPGGCQTVIVKTGTMKLGNLTVDLDPDSMMIAGGNKITPGPPMTWDFFPKDGGVHANPIQVPGGALGVGSAEDFGPTRIIASVEQVGTPVFNLPSPENMTVKLPIRIKLSNPLLGDNCYLGTTDDPIDLDLKVDPSTGGQPAGIPSGEVGTYFPGYGAAATDFAVPGATGCGPLGSLNWAVNLRAGLPSASGNSLTTTVDMYTASSWMVYQSQQNP